MLPEARGEFPGAEGFVGVDNGVELEVEVLDVFEITPLRS